MNVRRIYADSIRGQRHDCAALIDHQLAMRDAARAGETPSEGDRSAAAALIRQAGEQCCGPILGSVDSYNYWGGMVEEVQVDALRFVDCAYILKGCIPLRMLTLTRLHGHIEKVLAEPILGQLVSLDVGENRLTDDDIVALANSPLLKELRVLRIAGNLECGYRALRALTALPNLRFVDSDDTKTPLRIYLDDCSSPTREVDYTAAQGRMESELGPLPWVIGALQRPSNHEL